jgi:uncharacterized protein (TIGR03435 family)
VTEKHSISAWPPIRRRRSRARAAFRAALARVTDRRVALSLFEAVDKQMGLKLEMQKHPVPVLVIDHIEEKPTITDGAETLNEARYAGAKSSTVR